MKKQEAIKELKQTLLEFDINTMLDVGPTGALALASLGTIGPLLLGPVIEKVSKAIKKRAEREITDEKTRTRESVKALIRTLPTYFLLDKKVEEIMTSYKKELKSGGESQEARTKMISQIANQIRKNFPTADTQQVLNASFEIFDEMLGRVVITEEISGEEYKDHFSTDTPRHDVADPSERLINLLFAAEQLRKKFGNMSPEEIAEKLGVAGSKRALDLIMDLKNNPLYK